MRYIELVKLKQFVYNEKTGEIFYKARKLGYKTNGVGRGYFQCMIGDKTYMLHRIAWAVYYNEEPPQIIDHINGDGFDNSISNLRKADRRINGQNRKSHRSGRLVGARKQKNGTWTSGITINKKAKYLGTFETELEAHQAYMTEFKALTQSGNGKAK